MGIRESNVAIDIGERIEIEHVNHAGRVTRVHRDMYEAMGPLPRRAFIGIWDSQNASPNEYGYDL